MINIGALSLSCASRASELMLACLPTFETDSQVTTRCRADNASFNRSSQVVLGTGRFTRSVKFGMGTHASEASKLRSR